MLKKIKTDYSVNNDALVVFDKDDKELQDYIRIKKVQSEVLAKALHKAFSIRSFIDISCGLGTNLLAFNNLGCKGWGTEHGYMLSQVLPEVRNFVRDLDITIPIEDRKKQYDLVLCSEVLEHIEEGKLDIAIENLKQLAKNYIVVTIPLINPGYEACANHIEWQGDCKNWARKLTEEELWKNEDGTISQGHVTMATEKWWETIFNRNSLYRDRSKEYELFKDLEKGEIASFYNLFVLSKKPVKSIKNKTNRIKIIKNKITNKYNLRVSSFSSRLLLKKIHTSSTNFQPGEMFFIEVEIQNLSSRVFFCQASDEKRIRLGVRFKGTSFTPQNLPIYLPTKRLYPNKATVAKFQIKVPYNDGQYNCQISLVEEGIGWFCDINVNQENIITMPVVVQPRN